jgi:transposase
MSSVTALSSPEHRRRWSAEQRNEIVEESLRPGAVVAVVARRHDVHPSLVHAWRREARRSAAEAEGVSFVPVTVAEKKPATARGLIEIDLGKGMRLRVDGGVDEKALGPVRRALGR